MFSNAFVSLIIAGGIAAWIYTKLLRSTGNNTQNAVIGAAISGVIIFIVVFTLVGMIIKP